MDRSESVLMVLLDLNAAFDTIDHAILLSRLKPRTGISGAALQGLKSYLSNYTFQVAIGSDFFRPGTPRHWISSRISPAWVLSCLLCTFCKLGDILLKYNIMSHGYADDTQMYCYFNSRDPTSLQSALRSTECCLNELGQWMVVNKLKLNAQKTEFIIFTPAHLRPLVDQLQPVLRVGDALISPSSVVRNLGVFFDSGLTMLPHISRTVQGVFEAIKNISRVRRYLDDNTCARIVQALAISKLDCANSLLAGLPKCALRRLGVAQNSAARLVSRASGRTRITPVLKHLHRLPVHLRAEYKLLSIMFSLLNTNTVPIYLKNLLLSRVKVV